MADNIGVSDETREYLRTIGKAGGQQTSEAKREAARASAAKARVAKAFYQRHPDLHPRNRKQQP